MNIQKILDLIIKGITSPLQLWHDELEEIDSWSDILKFMVLPLVGLVTLVHAILVLLFGYPIPFMGVIKPSLTEVVIQALGSVIMYAITIVAMSWVAAYLAEMMGGKRDMNSAMLMLFLVSIPSLVGQVFGTLPFVGFLLTLGLAIYSLVLLYKAIPIFMEVPLSRRIGYILLLLLATIIVSLVLQLTLGQLFAPTMPEMPEMGTFEMPMTAPVK